MPSRVTLLTSTQYYLPSGPSIVGLNTLCPTMYSLALLNSLQVQLLSIILPSPHYHSLSLLYMYPTSLATQVACLPSSESDSPTIGEAGDHYRQKQRRILPGRVDCRAGVPNRVTDEVITTL